MAGTIGAPPSTGYSPASVPTNDAPVGQSGDAVPVDGQVSVEGQVQQPSGEVSSEPAARYEGSAKTSSNGAPPPPGFGPTDVVSSGGQDVRGSSLSNEMGDMANLTASVFKSKLEGKSEEKKVKLQSAENFAKLGAAARENLSATKSEISRLEGKDELSDGEQSKLDRLRGAATQLEVTVSDLDSKASNLRSEATDIDKDMDAIRGQLKTALANLERAETAKEKNKAAAQEQSKPQQGQNTGNASTKGQQENIKGLLTTLNQVFPSPADIAEMAAKGPVLEAKAGAQRG